VRFNLPNTLTLLRVAAIPLMAVLFYGEPPFSTWGAASVFTIAAVTDWFDGWLARRSGQTTAFGAFLDPVADKLIVATALVLLVHRFDNSLVTLCACVIVGREIVVSALREWMAQLGRSTAVKVSQLGKWKTGFQMTAIGMLLVILPDTYKYWSWFAQAILFFAVVLTLWSMMIYLQAFAQVLREQEG